MFTKTKKILSVSWHSLQCSLLWDVSLPSQSSKTNKSSQTNKSPQTTKAPQDLYKGSTRNLKWTDQQMTIQKVFLASNIKN